VCERVTSAAGIGQDAAPTDLHGVSSEACGFFPPEPWTMIRATDGDPLCSGKDDCFETAGSPVAGGCPNTCSCMCVCGLCFQWMCTMVGGCTEPPIYR